MALVEVKNLIKSYGSVKAVDDFSFQVNRGEIYALVGPDGAGKTTIIRTLCNLVSPDSGSAEIAGLDASKEFDRIKLILGYMPQIFSLYPDLTVAENLSFYAGIYGITSQAYRDKVEYLYRFSNLKPFAKRRAHALSGGMKQKLALSCALMHDPEVLILDEPTTGVDPLSRRQFWEILLRLKSDGATIIVSTPYMDEVARADRACFIFNGRKLAEDSPDRLPEMFRGSLYHLDRTPSTDLLRQLNRLENVSARQFGAGIHVFVAEGESLSRFASELQRLGVTPEDFRPIKADLEDCFIQLMEKA